MKDLITLRTENVPFTFNDIHQHRDAVAMGSPLGPVLAGIVMVELENSIVPKLYSLLCLWKRYVNDTLTTVKEESVYYVLQQLDSFHPMYGWICDHSGKDTKSHIWKHSLIKNLSGKYRKHCLLKD